VSGRHNRHKKSKKSRKSRKGKSAEGTKLDSIPPVQGPDGSILVPLVPQQIYWQVPPHVVPVPMPVPGQPYACYPAPPEQPTGLIHSLSIEVNRLCSNHCNFKNNSALFLEDQPERLNDRKSWVQPFSIVSVSVSSEPSSRISCGGLPSTNLESLKKLLPDHFRDSERLPGTLDEPAWRFLNPAVDSSQLKTFPDTLDNWCSQLS